MAEIALSVSKSWLKVASNQFFIKVQKIQNFVPEREKTKQNAAQKWSSETNIDISMSIGISRSIILYARIHALHTGV